MLTNDRLPVIHRIVIAMPFKLIGIRKPLKNQRQCLHVLHFSFKHKKVSEVKMFICQQDTLHHFEKETVRAVLNEASTVCFDKLNS